MIPRPSVEPFDLTDKILKRICTYVFRKSNWRLASLWALYREMEKSIVGLEICLVIWEFGDTLHDSSAIT